MTTDLNGPPSGSSALARELRKARVNMVALNDALTDILDQARSGDARALRDLGARAEDLLKAFQKADDAERKLNDWISKHSGAAVAGTHDLAAARAEVESRLDRLRELAAQGDAAGGPE